jgi:hypothetical protein
MRRHRADAASSGADAPFPATANITGTEAADARESKSRVTKKETPMVQTRGEPLLNLLQPPLRSPATVVLRGLVNIVAHRVFLEKPLDVSYRLNLPLIRFNRLSVLARVACA